jgi:hypothetical protein
MKSFVRENQGDSRDPLLIVALIGTMMFAAEELGEIAYLPLYAFLAIEWTRRYMRRRQRSKALLGEARSKGNR